MTRFYTRRGDKGISIMGNRRLSKDDLIFEVLGSLDELNSWLGVCQSKSGKFREIEQILLEIQESIFLIQAEIGCLGMKQLPRKVLEKDSVVKLEKVVENFGSKIPEITKFVISGGDELSASLDYARTLVRNAERKIVKYAKNNKTRPEIIEYINRLSSLLFALARYVNHKLKIKEKNPSY